MSGVLVESIRRTAPETAIRPDGVVVCPVIVTVLPPPANAVEVLIDPLYPANAGRPIVPPPAGMVVCSVADVGVGVEVGGGVGVIPVPPPPPPPPHAAIPAANKKAPIATKGRTRGCFKFSRPTSALECRVSSFSRFWARLG